MTTHAMSTHAVTTPDAAPAADEATFSRTTRASLCAVLEAYRDGRLPEERLAASARAVADDAHRRGLAAARMLVALKGEWAALEPVRRLSMLDARGPRELLDRLVTLSIGGYYADRGQSAGPAAAPPPAGEGAGQAGRRAVGRARAGDGDDWRRVEHTGADGATELIVRRAGVTAWWPCAPGTICEVTAAEVGARAAERLRGRACES
jgi:hypothetical protein